MDSAQDSDLAPFSEYWNQNEKLSEIKPPLDTKIEWLFLGMKVKAETIQLASV